MSLCHAKGRFASIYWILFVCFFPLLEEFKSFALKHPEYAKIFTTYLDLQTCHVFSLPDEVQPTPLVASNKVSPENHDESTSDKKDDWRQMFTIRKSFYLKLRRHLLIVFSKWFLSNNDVENRELFLKIKMIDFLIKMLLSTMYIIK